MRAFRCLEFFVNLIIVTIMKFNDGGLRHPVRASRYHSQVSHSAD